jgi:hypothetical protein
MTSRVDQVLGMSLNADDGEEVIFADSGIPAPYLQYTAEQGGPSAASDDRSVKGDKSSRPKTGKKKTGSSGDRADRDRDRDRERDRGDRDRDRGASASATAGSQGGSSRPKSASRRRDEGASGNGSGRDDGYGVKAKSAFEEDDYPMARGLIRK